MSVRQEFPQKLPIHAGLMLAFLVALPVASGAQTYYVRAGAGGNGTDWANAYPSLPATLVRGATYYVAAGSYGGYTFDDPASGTSLITIRKATATDHGSSTGWQAGYANQAVFTGSLRFQSNYYVFDGQYRNPDWRTGYGFKVDVSGAGGSFGVYVGIPFQLAASNITMRYTEIQGTGNRTDAYNDRGFITALGSSNVTLSHSYIHDQGECNLHLFRTTDITIEYTWIARNHSSPAYHAEGIAAPEGTNNFVFRHNVMEDIEGTAYIATPTGGHPACAGTVQRDWYIYGNVFMRTSGSGLATGNGLVYVFDHRHTGEFVFHNNTVVNLENGFVGFEPGSASQGCGDSARVQNNIWFNTRYAVNRTASVSSLSWSHNSYVSTSTSDPDPNRQTGTTNPFVNWTAYDFRLNAATVAGASLAVPFNIDRTGAVRGSDGTWDRGALEFGGTPGPTAPSAPQNLRIISP